MNEKHSSRRVAARITSMIASVALVVSMTPTAAWASLAEQGSNEREAAQQQVNQAVQEEQQVPASEQDIPAAEAETQEQSESQPASQAQDKADAQPAGATLTTAESAALEAASADEIDDTSFVQIEASKDSGTQKNGNISHGDRLFANTYRVEQQEDEDGWGLENVDIRVTSDDRFSYQWYKSPTKSRNKDNYSRIEGATSQELIASEDIARSYIAVAVTVGDKTMWAPSSGSDINIDSLPYVIGVGEIELNHVSLDSKAPKVGDTITATAYKSYSSEVDEATNVSWTWSYSDSEYGTWTTIAGATGNTFTVPAELAGKFIQVSGSAGLNTETDNTTTKVKAEGQVDIYTAQVSTTKGDAKAASLYTVDDTLWAFAKEKGASTAVDESLLDYQWQVSATKTDKDFTNIEGATQSTLDLKDYEGKYVRCRIASKVGDSAMTTKATNPVGREGAINITNVSLSETGKVQVGTTLTATAKAGSDDVTSNEGVVWKWYTQTGKSNSERTLIDGATGNTLVITDAMLGSYVTASAEAGFSETFPNNAAGPITFPGMVELYKVEASGTPKIGQTVSATAYVSSSSKVSPSDVVTYQWQYADKKTTNDSGFKDIEGATSANYIIDEYVPGTTEKMSGKYLRVKATSENSVVSTSKKSYYGATSVDPLGPVVLDGGYDLSSIEISSSDAGAQVGATLTAKPQYMKQGSYDSYETDVPDDAKLTFEWHAVDAGGNDTLLASTENTLTLDESLVGKKVYVTASSLMTPATSGQFEVVPAGTYKLKNTNISPSASASLVTGDEVRASVFAYNLSNTGVNVTDKPGVTIHWQTADAADADDTQWSDIEGATNAKLAIPDSAKGKYLRVVASSGEGDAANSVSAAYTSPVADANSTAGMAAKLHSDGVSGWKPNPKFNTDTNVCDMLIARLQTLGVDTTGLSVSVSDVAMGKTMDGVSVGIATDAEHNGDITYMSCEDPSTLGYYTSQLQRVSSITFSLTRDGESASYTPGTFQIPWDLDKAEAQLATQAEKFAIAYAEDDSASSVTQDIVLPQTPSNASWAQASWTSSDTSVIRIPYSWDTNARGAVTRGATDKEVTLTATVVYKGSGLPDEDEVFYEMPVTVTVKGDSEKVAQEKADLQSAVDAFAFDKIRYASDKATIPTDGQGVNRDLQMPTTRDLKVDGSEYTVSYSSNNSDVLSFNGYRGFVVQPQNRDENVDVTLTVTNKKNPEITASKTLTLGISRLDEAEVDAEIALMQKAQAGYAQALLAQGDTQDAVTQNLHKFQEAYVGADGELAWARDVNSASAQSGIGLADFPEYEPMGSYDQARTFKSSNTDIVINEGLYLAWNYDSGTMLSQWKPQPVYNTPVTISSLLTSERYGRYYEAYKDDPTWGPKFEQLVNVPVSATFTVLGTSGQANPQFSVTASVIGVDGDGASEVWVPDTKFEYDNGSTVTAADLTEQMLQQNGLTYESSVSSFGYSLNSVSSPTNGAKFAYDAKTGKYWQLFVNGEASRVGASDVTLAAGDVVTWCYSAFGESIPSSKNQSIAVNVQVTGPNQDGANIPWVTTTEVKVPKGSNALTVSKMALNAAGYETDEELYTIRACEGKTLPNGATSLGADKETGKYWNFYINGEYAPVMASGYTVKPGDTISWIYKSDEEPMPASDVDVDPSAPHPSWQSEWPGFVRGASVDGASGAVTSAKTPFANTKKAWSFKPDGQGSQFGSASTSDPIIAGDYLYAAYGYPTAHLYKVDKNTGAALASAPLAARLDMTSRPVYANGLVIVPLHGGHLQALTADTLTTVWITDAIGGDTQTDCTLSVIGSTVLLASAENYGGKNGMLSAYNIATGALRWKTEANPEGGYYWNGAANVNGMAVIADNAGMVRSFDVSTGDVKGTLNLGSSVTSDVVAAPDAKSVYVVTKDGVLHTLPVAADGALSERGEGVKFADSSSSTPAIVNGMAIIGGTASKGGVLALVDLSTGSVRQITAADGERLLPVQSSPLVSVQPEGTYVYFAGNGAKGLLYGYKLGDSEAKVLYAPSDEEKNYADCSVIADAKGNLYYTLDSGYVIALTAAEERPAVEPDQGGAKKPGESEAPQNENSASENNETVDSMHRLYNSNSGEHFYTYSQDEYENLVGLGWTDEGTGWKAPEISNTPVYRMYNPNAGEHHYTSDISERDYLVSIGWNYEGIGWYSDDNQTTPLYRDYNPNAWANNHNYTTDAGEHEYLISQGWNAEGYGWYGL